MLRAQIWQGQGLPLPAGTKISAPSSRTSPGSLRLSRGNAVSGAAGFLQGKVLAVVFLTMIHKAYYILEVLAVKINFTDCGTGFNPFEADRTFPSGGQISLLYDYSY